ncbi:MAG: recombinase family protein [Synergistaceae bacterium]|jgi:DNA invertase Pin-like site-specific DNA recombinase|nr:recombinase family protein [Synergistaceae bacterium]
MKNKQLAYARVSMDSQDLALQLDALQAAGIEEKSIFVEKITGRLSRARRPQLAACMKALRPGDSLFVWKLDRLGRSITDLISIMQDLEERKIRFNSLTETIDTSTPAGRLVFHIIAAFGEFERNLIKERSSAGLAAAKKRGIIGGRKQKLSSQQQKNLAALYGANKPIKEIQKTFGISRPCLYNYLRLNNITLNRMNQTKKQA